MTQKIIRIGTSLGVTIPKKELAKQNIMAGDEVEITIQKKYTRATKNVQLLKDLKAFMNMYDKDLKNLADK